MALFGAGRLPEPGEDHRVRHRPLDRARPGRRRNWCWAGPAADPGGLRAAIATVMDVAPEKARKRREAAQKDARVQRWAEDSGNAALMGRELPPAEVLAADQRITARAQELRKAGLEGSMDELRARAYLDLLLGKTSRPTVPGDGGTGADGGNGADDGGNGGDGSPGGPGAGVVPAGFAVRGTLTVPLVTLARLADRAGELGGIGPVDPWLARDLAAAAAANPKTTWCVTVTGQDGHAVATGAPGRNPGAACAARDLRQARETGRTRDGGRDQGRPGRVRLHRRGAGGAAGRVRDLAAAHARGRAGPDRRAPSPRHRALRSPVPGRGPRSRGQAPAPGPGPARHLCQPGLPPAAAACDFEHNIPYEAGGRTCLCNAGPKCRHDHRLKQHPKWKVDQLPDGTFRWTTPSGRDYITEPTRYPV